MLNANNVKDVFYFGHMVAVNRMYMIFSGLAYQLTGIREQLPKSPVSFRIGFFELIPGI